MAHGPLSRTFYARDTARVARALLGCTLETTVRRAVTSGRIVEVEAYVGPHDPAAHGFGNRRTSRNALLFGPPGLTYVYFIYGMHWCVNAVTEREGFPAAVLIRALEPLEGLATMQRRRGTTVLGALCSGPAKLCQALGITGSMSGQPLDGARIRICGPARRRRGERVEVTPRVGITKATDWPLRFVLDGTQQ